MDNWVYPQGEKISNGVKANPPKGGDAKLQVLKAKVKEGWVAGEIDKAMCL